MKRIILLVVCALLAGIAFGQRFEQQHPLAKLVITDGSNNGTEMKPSSFLKEGAYTVFYTNGGDSLIYMSNNWANINSQSYGTISSQSIAYNQTYDTCRADIYYFKWHYANTYDNRSGIADIQLIKVYHAQGAATYVLQMLTDLGITIYKGYMEGSLDFLKPDKSQQTTQAVAGSSFTFSPVEAIEYLFQPIDKVIKQIEAKGFSFYYTDKFNIRTYSKTMNEFDSRVGFMDANNDSTSAILVSNINEPSSQYALMLKTLRNMGFEFKEGVLVLPSNDTVQLAAPPAKSDDFTWQIFDNGKGFLCMLKQIEPDDTPFIQRPNSFEVAFFNRQLFSNGNEQSQDSTQTENSIDILLHGKIKDTTDNNDTTEQTVQQVIQSRAINFKAYSYSYITLNTKQWADTTSYNGRVTLNFRKRKITMYNSANNSTVYFTIYNIDTATTDSAGNTILQMACIDSEGNTCYVRLVNHHELGWQLYIDYTNISVMLGIKPE